jgi:hypothetical protein
VEKSDHDQGVMIDEKMEGMCLRVSED